MAIEVTWILQLVFMLYAMEKSIQKEHVRRTWKFRTVMAEIEQNTAKEIAKNLTFASVNL